MQSGHIVRCWGWDLTYELDVWGGRKSTHNILRPWVKRKLSVCHSASAQGLLPGQAMAVKLQFLSGRIGQVKTVHGEEEGQGDGGHSVSQKH